VDGCVIGQNKKHLKYSTLGGKESNDVIGLLSVHKMKCPVVAWSECGCNLPPKFIWRRLIPDVLLFEGETFGKYEGSTHVYGIGDLIQRDTRAGSPWLMPVTLASWEAEIGRIRIQDQPRQNRS
jgi:hypothetical protein